MKVKYADGTGVRQYRHVVEDSDRHGNVRIYLRRKGERKVRLREKPGTPEFDTEYMAAFRGTLQAVPIVQKGLSSPGTFRWLCQQYYASATFAMLDESTRRVRRGILDSVCERAGMFRFALMEPSHVAKLRDEKAATPHAANNRVKAIRQLFKWASSTEYGYARKNPAREVSYLKGANPDGIKAWTEGDVAAYEARHPIGTKARLALDLLLFTGVRRSDVVKLGPQMERDDLLVFTETKGRAHIVKTHEIPILPPLRASINAAPIGHLVYLATAWGKPHTATGFATWFKRQCRMAGLNDVSAHGLRKLGATRCAEAGATEHQLMALFGWLNAQQAAVYTRKANRKRLEADAAPLLQGRNLNKKVPLFPAVTSGGTSGAKI
jgi:integrase